MSELLVTLYPELSTHNDSDDGTYTSDQSSTLTTPPTPDSEDSTAIGGGSLLAVVDIGTIDYIVVRAKCYVVNPLAGDAGVFSNSRVVWIQDNAPTATSVAGCNCTAGNTSVSEPSAGAFDFVKVGSVITVDAGDTVTLPGDTFVTSNVSGIITISNAFGGSNDASTTLYFDRRRAGFMTAISEVGLDWVVSGNITTSPDNAAWTWDTLKNHFRDVTPLGTFYQDLEPASTVMEVRCSEVQIEVWGTPLPKSFTLIPHAGAWV